MLLTVTAFGWKTWWVELRKGMSVVYTVHRFYNFNLHCTGNSHIIHEWRREHGSRVGFTVMQLFDECSGIYIHWVSQILVLCMWSGITKWDIKFGKKRSSYFTLSFSFFFFLTTVYLKLYELYEPLHALLRLLSLRFRVYMESYL